MRSWPIIAAAVWLTSGAALAQTAIPIPEMGMTSSLGSLGSASPFGTMGSYSPTGNSPTGVPLGATEINPGGLSPSPAMGCAAGTSSWLAGTAGMSAMSGMSSTFDGAGLATTGSTGAVGSAASSPGCPSSAPDSPNGTASPLSLPGTTSTTLNGGTIPLGATELNSSGVSPLVAVPAPSSATTITTPGVSSGP